MSKFVKILLVLAFAAGVWVGVKLMMEQKERFLALSEDEQRAFLADKIGSKVPEEKLVEIQDAVISAVSGKKADQVT